MKNIWNEAAIRKEFARLDAKTGLKGATLPIIFNNAKCTLGSYNPANGGHFDSADTIMMTHRGR